MLGIPKKLAKTSDKNIWQKIETIKLEFRYYLFEEIYEDFS